MLAAWIPFWTFASAVGTKDFFGTSSGHASIGSFFLPRGVADGLTVVGIGVMIYAFIGLERRNRRTWVSSDTVPLPQQPVQASTKELETLKLQYESETRKHRLSDAVSELHHLIVAATVRMEMTSAERFKNRISTIFNEAVAKAALDLETLIHIPEGEKVTVPAADSWMTQLAYHERLGRQIRERIRLLQLLGPKLGIDVSGVSGQAKIELLNSLHKLQRTVN